MIHNDEVILLKRGGRGNRITDVRGENVRIHPSTRPTKTKYINVGGVTMSHILKSKKVSGSWNVGVSGAGVWGAKTAAELKAAVRRIRPQEAERLAEIDAEIKRLTQERIELKREAFKRGHVVRFNEIEETYRQRKG